MDQSFSTRPLTEPETPIRDVVAAAWALALRRQVIDPDADFRAIGVNANRALRLMREIWSTTGRELPINVLFETPTIRRMAAAIEDGSAFIAPDLVRLRDGSPANPLFIFGGGGGYLVDLVDLAAAIQTEGAIHGVPAAGMDGRGTLHERYENEAVHARDVIKRAQPDGPYRLLGYSNGGLAALETARLMRRHGDDVAFLGLLDTGLDDKYWPLPIWFGFIVRKAAAKLLQGARRAVRGSPARALAAMTAARKPDISPKRRGSQYTYRFRDPDGPCFPHYSPYWESHHTPRYSLVREAAGRMKGHYRPSPYDGRVHFFTASIVDRLTVAPQLLWPRYLPRAEWITLPGNHLTIIFGRQAARLAREISSRL